jgi:hypothetical protein
VNKKKEHQREALELGDSSQTLNAESDEAAVLDKHLEEMVRSSESIAHSGCDEAALIFKTGKIKEILK